MYLAGQCHCCAGDRFRTYPAVVAPFVAERALLAKPTRSRLLECESCGFRFFELRLDDDETRRLYRDYRGSEYFAQRHRHEWWYTRRANDGLGGDESVSEARRSTMRAFIGRHVDLETIGSVLDYGGDRGQLIPCGNERCVYEVSDVEPVAGVRALRTPEALEGRSFELVLLCQVLEHASEPSALLAKLSALATRLVYIEVPFERPVLRGVLRGGVGERYVELLLRHPKVLRNVDFVSTAGRVGAGIVPPLGLLKAHEHLNFFEERSLRALVERSALEVIACGLTHVGKTVNLSCLARPRGEVARS